MRRLLIAALLLSATPAPLAAQETERAVDRRVERLERQVRTLERRVLGANTGVFEAEVTPTAAPATGAPAASQVSDLQLRIDALERTLQTITGQVEQNGYQLRQMQEALAQYRAATDGRLVGLEGGRAPVAPAASAVEPTPEVDVTPANREVAPSSTPAAVPISAPATGDPAEDAYTIGFRQWEAKQYEAAAETLKAVVARYPKHRRASWAQNLAGRAMLDGGKPAAAAELFLANYQKMPEGERAADSLLFLGQSLTRLNKLEQACRVYDELNDVYGGAMRAFVRDQLPGARRAAKCKA